MRPAAIVALSLLAPVSSACGLFEELPPLPTATPSAENRLVNGELEAGIEPWRAPNDAVTLWSTSSEQAHRGEASAYIELRGDEGATGAAAVGGAQDINPESFPEYISGHYRVEEWEDGGALQYLEFAVTVFGGDFPGGAPWHEVRFIILGAERDPFIGPTTRWIYLDRDAPEETGEWAYFAYPLVEAFGQQLGHVPASWDRIQVSFQARYQEKPPGEPSIVRVYLDDLYAGSQVGNPNRVEF